MTRTRRAPNRTATRKPPRTAPETNALGLTVHEMALASRGMMDIDLEDDDANEAERAALQKFLAAGGWPGGL